MTKFQRAFERIQSQAVSQVRLTLHYTAPCLCTNLVRAVGFQTVPAVRAARLWMVSGAVADIAEAVDRSAANPRWHETQQD